MNTFNSTRSDVSSLKLFFICCVTALSLSLTVQANEDGDRNKPRHERPKFSELDLDGDDSVTFAEFEQSRVPNNDHAVIFSHIDTNADGLLTIEELVNHKPPRRKR